ncbi:V-set and immunoglobulin domain-containing protein 4-like isoform X3 [Pleurodeles waltl]|uniref:V-set and immunoglobulin domain-containing protein 4-like isoform X3 n=1 Tax=Pleurodeles waltl TaxID=8319 RepID=UPI00370949AF
MRVFAFFLYFVASLTISREFNLTVQQDVHGTWRSSVILPCSYSPVHDTLHRVTWRMHGQMILASDSTGDHTFLTKDRGRLSLPWERQGGAVSLTIMNLQIDDGGQYSCEVSLMLNGTGDLVKKEAVINLDVRKVAVTKPLIQHEGSSLEVSEGATVNLTCSAEGSPPITYRWFKRDQAPGSGTVFQSGISLLINNFQASHSGTYYCEAENRIPAKTTQQSEEVHLSVRDDIIAQWTTPKSRMVSPEDTVPTEWSGSTHHTKAPSSANAAGAASQTPPSTRILKTVMHTTESHGNNRRPYHTDPTGRHTPVNNMTTTHSAASSASSGLALPYIILIIVLSLAFLCILIVAVVIQRRRRKTSGQISEMPSMNALNARASQDSAAVNVPPQGNGCHQTSGQNRTTAMPRTQNEYQLMTAKESEYQAISRKPENEYELLMQPRQE